MGLFGKHTGSLGAFPSEDDGWKAQQFSFSLTPSVNTALEWSSEYGTPPTTRTDASKAIVLGQIDDSRAVFMDEEKEYPHDDDDDSRADDAASLIFERRAANEPFRKRLWKRVCSLQRKKTTKRGDNSEVLFVSLASEHKKEQHQPASLLTNRQLFRGILPETSSIRLTKRSGSVEYTETTDEEDNYNNVCVINNESSADDWVKYYFDSTSIVSDDVIMDEPAQFRIPPPGNGNY
jgi:hypothetical protein